MQPNRSLSQLSQPSPDCQVAGSMAAQEAVPRLAAFIRRCPRLFILTGAGISTDSGIPDYRDREGAWKRKQPVQHQDFMGEPALRQRYWGRSLVGWPRLRDTCPNRAHHSLVELERRGQIGMLVTQNVDRLHQRAGSGQVMDLHGRADQVICMDCGHRIDQDEVHARHQALNPDFQMRAARIAPDGDADLEADFSHFRVFACPRCNGILKPDVVFFGDCVPRDRVESARDALQSCDGVLVIGSSLMVLSGFRFCRYARDWNKPIAVLNLGRTRADGIADLRVCAPIGETLEGLIEGNFTSERSGTIPLTI